MQRFLVNSSLVPSADVQRDLERAAQAVKANQTQHKSKGVAKKHKYWLKWGDAERRDCVDIHVKRDMKGIQLHYGTVQPPRTTIRSGERNLLKGLQSPIPLGAPPSCELSSCKMDFPISGTCCHTSHHIACMWCASWGGASACG